MRDVLLSVLIPLYNEEEYIWTVLDRVLAAPLPETGHKHRREVIVVDDGSTDGSPETLLEFNRITYPGWYINGRLLKRRNFGRLQLSVFDRLVPVWRRIDRFLPWSPTSIIAVGVREN